MDKPKIVTVEGLDVGCGKSRERGVWIALGGKGISRCDFLDRANALALRDALNRVLGEEHNRHERAAAGREAEFPGCASCQSPRYRQRRFHIDFSRVPVGLRQEVALTHESRS